MDKDRIKRLAREIRIETMKEIGELGFGHVGGSLSIADLLAVLYGEDMKIDPKDPKMENRDWLVLSKGHAGPAMYATLALKGFFDKEILKTLNRGGTILPSHTDRNKTPGVDMTTGSLGQGMSAACGIALGNKRKGLDNWTYCIIGDGEMQEGQNWEAALFAPQFNLDHLIVFIDNNKQQIDADTKDEMNIEDIGAKYAAFNWHVQRIDGHDVEAIHTAIANAKAAAGKPSFIVLDTIKGKGCSFAMNRPDNHHMHVTKEEVEGAIKELESSL